MQIRRKAMGASPEFEVLVDGTWVRLEGDGGSHAELIAMLRARSPSFGNGSVVSGLPFQPLSYRDFMLYERHYVQAGRGYLRRFRPGVARLAWTFEALTKRVFPPLRPPHLWYEQPIYYMGNHLQFVGDGAEVVWPAYTTALDYELELGFVLKREIEDATPDEALAAIGGFVVFNDFSARDVQTAEMRSGFGPQKAKHFCNAMSSVVVSADELLPRLTELTGHVSINGQRVARCSPAGAQFTLGEALAHVSKSERLRPGEFFATGTWPNGSGMENGHWLRPGDTVQVEIVGIGTLSNKIGVPSAE